MNKPLASCEQHGRATPPLLQGFKVPFTPIPVNARAWRVLAGAGADRSAAQTDIRYLRCSGRGWGRAGPNSREVPLAAIPGARWNCGRPRVPTGRRHASPPSCWIERSCQFRHQFRRMKYSAADRLALLARPSGLLDLLDVVEGHRHLAGRVTHVDADFAQLLCRGLRLLREW